MGTVLIHAGMSKTGSTSLQTWLRTHARSLRDEQAIHLLRDARARSEGSLDLEIYESGIELMPVAFLLTYAGLHGTDPGALTELTAEFIRALDEQATALGTVLLTSEAFAGLLVGGEEPFLRGLEQLAGCHTVRLAYYVRPQDTALESRWRQWGYRSELSPRAWVEDQVDQLRYTQTLAHVDELAPSVSFEVRPFRDDLLEGGDVVADFAHHFLGLTDLCIAPSDENAGLPLDLVNLLRVAPTDLLEARAGTDGAQPDWGARQAVLGRLSRSWAIPASSAVARSRLVLRSYAHAEFEAENQVLLQRFCWPTDNFVVPCELEGGRAPDLAELDQLWEPHATETELAYFYAALGDLVGAIH